MDLDDEERIGESLNLPKLVKVKDVRVCIFEMQGISGTICNFLYAYPYLEISGGMIIVYNPSYLNSSNPEKWKRVKEFDDKLMLWQSFWRIKAKALRDNPDLKVLYLGPILRDDYYGA